MNWKAQHKKKIIWRISIRLIIFFSLASNHFSQSFYWGNQSHPFELKQSMHIDNSHSDILQLEKNNYKKISSINDDSLYLSFDKRKNPHSISEAKSSQIIRNGNVLKALYKDISFEDSVNTSASFEHPFHKIIVSPPRYLFLNEKESIQKFSIHFLMKPYQLKQEMEVFRKYSLFGGQKYGIQCIWKNGYIQFIFHRFFYNKGTAIPKIIIRSRDTLNIQHFQSILLTYKKNTGALTLYINNLEQNKLFITTNKNSDGSILNAHFHKWDNSLLIFGKDYLGALDEVIFSNNILNSNFKTGRYNQVQKIGSRYIQIPGVAISRRINLKYSHSRIKNMSFQIKEPKGTDIKFFIRYSNKPFPENASEQTLPFQEIIINKKNKKELNSFQQYYINFKNKNGKYLQWKALLYSNAIGTKTPVIKSLSITTEENHPPLPPQHLQIYSIGKQEVTLIFMRNVELDVINKGRYHVYYGLEPNKPLGVIRYKSIIPIDQNTYKTIPISDKDKWKTNDLRYQNRIQVKINNDLIRQHIEYNKLKPYFQYEYPFLQSNIPFYFWVTACDSSWTENIENSDHESKPSNFVLVRPK